MEMRIDHWTEDEALTFLRDARLPLRLSMLGSDGAPRMVSLWYAWDGSALWCATPATAFTAVELARDARCAFEVSTNEPPYRGVRGSALATLVPARGREVLDELLTRYLTERNAVLRKWLTRREVEEVAIRIEPTSAFAWNFRGRMEPET